MAKGSGTTRSGSSSNPRGLSGNGRSIDSLREGVVYSGRGSDNQFIEYEITRDSLTGQYSLISHELLTDSYGNRSGRTSDVQETAPTLDELKDKIKREGYTIL